MDSNTDRYQQDEQRWSSLMVQAQQGDEQAYHKLLGELVKVIERYLISRLGAQHFVDDCVQDILLSIHNARHTYQPQRPFRPWLFAIVRNRSIDNLRKRQNFTKLVGELEQEALVDQDIRDQDAGNGLDNQVVQGQVIAALEPQYREAIVLTKFYGLSNAEAAAQLSITETAVKVRVHRGIAKLKALFAADKS